MAYSGLSNSQFADKAGIPRPTLSQLLHGRNKSINDMFLRKINESFPQLDVRWLLFGTGDMLSIENTQTSEPQNGADSVDFTGQNADKQSIFDYLSLSNNLAENTPEENQTLFDATSGADSTAKTPPKAGLASEAPFMYEVRALENTERQDSAGETCIKKATPRKVTSIIVLYSDGSFETFSPAD